MTNEVWISKIEMGGLRFGYKILGQAVLASYRRERSSTLPTVEREAAAGMGICARGLVCEGSYQGME